MKITITRENILRMMSQKLDIPEDEIELDMSGCIGEVANTEPSDDDSEGDEECNCNAITVDSSAVDIVNVTKIDKVFEKALTDTGNKSRIPKDSTAVCVKGTEKLIASMTRKERKLFNQFVSMKDFKAFAIIWQELQTQIQKSM